MEINKNDIDKTKLPSHIAIIMDGNGRWAKQQGMARLFGHKYAIRAVTNATEGCAELGIKYLTLYAFSKENWGRPKEEVDGLMKLLSNTIDKEINRLIENQVRLLTLGNLSDLPSDCRIKLQNAIEITKNNTGITVLLALNYSGRWDILEATKKISVLAKNGEINIEDIEEEMFCNYLETATIPDPELLIRTGGDLRVSNFLLWQMAYTELYITPSLWPDFTKQELYQAILTYQGRERRFGKIIESNI